MNLFRDQQICCISVIEEINAVGQEAFKSCQMQKALKGETKMKRQEALECTELQAVELKKLSFVHLAVACNRCFGQKLKE